ncbi:MltR family transcriptional regulator [Aliagarivorans marinus]|uniref:MltR family transcriptional regulator n=1 Tax=Aliagarivorans marinus TaxID=561965 RepID=UPI00040A4342|nr:MltR family transcriptional regulator [Aliagarivorans marinus]
MTTPDSKPLSPLSALLNSSIGRLGERLEQLLSQVLSGEDDATRYVTAPLFSQRGPLAEPLVKARLMVALGYLSPQHFADIITLQAIVEASYREPSEQIPPAAPEHYIAELLPKLAKLSGFDNSLLRHFYVRLDNLPQENALRDEYLQTLNKSIYSALEIAIDSLLTEVGASQDKGSRAAAGLAKERPTSKQTDDGLLLSRLVKTGAKRAKE